MIRKMQPTIDKSGDQSNGYPQKEAEANSIQNAVETKPTWTAAAKSGIGKAINANSQIVFTLHKGIVTEVYYPREDIACIKDCNLIVTDGRDFFSDEKNHTRHEVTMIKEGIPAYKVVNRCNEEKYIIEKEIIADPIRSTLLQKIVFRRGNKKSNYNLYVTINPHINNHGSNNKGWLGNYKGVKMLFACKDGLTLALACSTDFLKRSVGHVGTNDGWHDLAQHKEMRWQHEEAEGNIALTAQIDLSAQNAFVLAIGFGRTECEAANRAWASLLDGFELAKEKYTIEWERWYKTLKTGFNKIGKLAKTSVAVLRMSEAKSFAGGIIASVAIPWGNAGGDKDASGYHMVWPRDLVESSGGFLAIKSKEHTLRIANYLLSTQEPDGKWAQNMWLEGDAHWTGIQMDQVALPVILVEKCFRQRLIDDDRMSRYWPIIKKAASFLILNGPSSQQDRWEVQPGLTPFTLAVEITGLLAAANLAQINDDKKLAAYFRETADTWNNNIDSWLYVTDTALSEQIGVEGYYMRINPYYLPASEVKDKIITLTNRKDDEGKIALGEIICADALSFVRHGLRAADDPKILNTIKAIDATLKVDTPFGPCWHRYNLDGYGEDENGDPYIKTGIGRAWPLLTGERGHYEIAAGNIHGAKNLLKTMEAFSENGFLPEQVWDTKDIPEKDLYFGRPSGSAMPLTWAHAEYIKLCCSIRDEKVFDMNGYVYKRYVKQKITSNYSIWRFNWHSQKLLSGQILRIELQAEATVRWTDDNWQTTHESKTREIVRGLHYTDLRVKNQEADSVIFTFFWHESNHWEENNFQVLVQK